MKFVLAAMLLFAHTVFADEIADSFEALKKAMEAKNVREVKRLALETSRMSRAEAAKPQPEDASQLDYWKQRISYLQQMDVFTEYALGATAIAPGLAPSDVQLLVETLLDQNGKSAYIEMTVGSYIGAVQKTEGTDGQMRAAARMLVLFTESEDALLALAEGNLGANQMKDAGEYAARLVRTLEVKPKPISATEADWQRKKEALLARGHYIAGVSACLSDAFAQCNVSLRAAAPMLAAQTAVHGPLYFYLGLSNYNIAKATKNRTTMQEAIAYGKQASAIAGPLQTAARQNVTIMENALKTMK